MVADIATTGGEDETLTGWTAISATDLRTRLRRAEPAALARAAIQDMSGAPPGPTSLVPPRWNWRKRSSVKITERTYEEGTEAFHTRRTSQRSESPRFREESLRLGMRAAVDQVL